MTNCLILNNFVTVIVKQVIHNSYQDRKLSTIRMEYIIIFALKGKDCRDDVLRMTLSNLKRKTKFVEVLDKLKVLKLTFYCNAVAEEEVV